MSSSEYKLDSRYVHVAEDGLVAGHNDWGEIRSHLVDGYDTENMARTVEALLGTIAFKNRRLMGPGVAVQRMGGNALADTVVPPTDLLYVSTTMIQNLDGEWVRPGMR